MQVVIRIESERQEEELRSLDGWLRQEPAIRRTATVSLRTETAASGSMGGLIDSLGLIH
ncbi:effector-associated constant component EACC1 [Streptomyces sp. HUAS TT20]|uniref:effector-associated constant component EACC1 n=1 Tax=Streptomyces sp. HUAS TT20 TaxID=3447509 RepID=UPI0039884FA9